MIKLTKNKEVITEEVVVKAGVYYFEDDNVVAHKFTLLEAEDSYSEYILETLFSFSNKKGILIKEDGAWDEEDLPYIFKLFITGVEGKKIKEEDYHKERQEILNKLV